MTEFLRDFNFVKSKIEKSRTLTQVMESKQYIDFFVTKYVVQVSHMNPIFIVHTNELNDLYQKKFKTFSSCV